MAFPAPGVWAPQELRTRRSHCTVKSTLGPQASDELLGVGVAPAPYIPPSWSSGPPSVSSAVS